MRIKIPYISGTDKKTKVNYISGKVTNKSVDSDSFETRLEIEEDKTGRNIVLYIDLKYSCYLDKIITT